MERENDVIKTAKSGCGFVFQPRCWAPVQAPPRVAQGLRSVFAYYAKKTCQFFD